MFPLVGVNLVSVVAFWADRGWEESKEGVMEKNESESESDEEERKRMMSVVMETEVVMKGGKEKGFMSSSTAVGGGRGGGVVRGKASMREWLGKGREEFRVDGTADKISDLLFRHLDRNFVGWEEEKVEVVTEQQREEQQEAVDVDRTVRLFRESPPGLIRLKDETQWEKKQARKREESSSGSDDDEDRKRVLDSVLVEFQSGDILPRKLSKTQTSKDS